MTIGQVVPEIWVKISKLAIFMKFVYNDPLHLRNYWISKPSISLKPLDQWFLTYRGSTYSNFMTIGQVVPEIQVKITKLLIFMKFGYIDHLHHRNYWICKPSLSLRPLVQFSWNLDQWFLTYRGLTYSNFITIGPVVLVIHGSTYLNFMIIGPVIPYMLRCHLAHGQFYMLRCWNENEFLANIVGTTCSIWISV